MGKQIILRIIIIKKDFEIIFGEKLF